MNNEGYPKLYAPDPATAATANDIVSLQSEINNIKVLLLSDFGAIVLFCPYNVSNQTALTSPDIRFFRPFYDVGYDQNFVVDNAIGTRFVLFTSDSIFNPGPCGLQWMTNPLPIPYVSFEVRVAASFIPSLDGFTIRLEVEPFAADGTSQGSQYFGQRSYRVGTESVDWSVHTIVHVPMPRVTRVTFVVMASSRERGSIVYGVGDDWGQNQIIVKRLK